MERDVRAFADREVAAAVGRETERLALDLDRDRALARARAERGDHRLVAPRFQSRTPP